MIVTNIKRLKKVEKYIFSRCKKFMLNFVGDQVENWEDS